MPRGPLWRAEGHCRGMQSVFSLAARRRAVPVLRDVRGRDGELKTDWTKPRAAAPIYGDCFRGPDHQGEGKGDRKA